MPRFTEIKAIRLYDGVPACPWSKAYVDLLADTDGAGDRSVTETRWVNMPLMTSDDLGSSWRTVVMSAIDGGPGRCRRRGLGSMTLTGER